MATSSSAYLDIGDYLRAATNQETASLLGLNTTLAAGVAAGALTLPVASSVGWAAGPAWLLDGPWAERAQLTGAPDGATLALAAPGVTLAHGAGVSISQAGPSGALAEVILRASGWIENYCRQGGPGDRALFALPRTERWRLPGPRAWLEPDGALAVRAGHFPVQTVTALSVETAPGAALALDVSQVELPSDGRLIELPPSALLPSGAIAPPPGLSRGGKGWLSVTYTGGPVTPGATPYDLRQACIWVVSELLSQRRNPTGAAAVRMGSFELTARPRTDPTGDSLLLIQAKAALQPYRVEW
ncbi:MAG TPA: hypothetical protein VHI51_11610 [Ktedonobacterales bacterium]|jgi:hypothetical protein|nr:hypothetical protein [Ktedonobacterales bacterium]